MSDVDTKDQLREEHESLQRAVQQSRKKFAASPLSKFAKEGWDAIEQYLKMREEGVSREDAVKGIEHVLRAIWPKATTKFHFCGDCDGTGWRLMQCWDQLRCGRERCAKNPEIEHSYVVPCDCTCGDRFRQRVTTPEDEIANVGKRKPKPKGFSPVGSR